MSTVAPNDRPRRVSAGFALLGIGLSGFFDGIVLHQLFQWHHMVSNVDRYPMNTLDGLQANTVADGLFHLGALAVTMIAVVVLVRSRQFVAMLTAHWVFAWLLIGFGGFNLVEGIVDHEVLRIHHVFEDAAHPWIWDIGFLVINAAIVLAGARLMRPARGDATARVIVERVDS